MNYDEMPAGPELDALVAEKVMGLEWREWIPYGAPQGWFPKDAPTLNWRDEKDRAYDPPEDKADLPAYSFDIAAAWEVVEKLDLAWWPEIGRMTDGSWYCEICRGADEPSKVGWPLRAVASEAPLAICRAALKAVAGATPPGGTG